MLQRVRGGGESMIHQKLQRGVMEYFHQWNAKTNSFFQGTGLLHSHRCGNKSTCFRGCKARKMGGQPETGSSCSFSRGQERTATAALSLEEKGRGEGRTISETQPLGRSRRGELGQAARD